MMVVERVQALFPAVLYLEAPDPAADLLDGGVLDSLALVELLAAIEVEFGIEIPLDELDIERVRTPVSIGELVDERLALEAPDAA